MAKLWLVSYSHQVFSFGSPYERAMRRQEAYNGVLAWNLNAIINALPIIIIISLACLRSLLGGFYYHFLPILIQSVIVRL